MRERKPAAPLKVSEAKDAARQSTDMIEFVGTLYAGDFGKMDGETRERIEGPLARVYQRHAAIGNAISRWSDPVALVAALAMYGMNVYMARAMLNAAAQQMAQPMYADSAAGAVANGTAPSGGNGDILATLQTLAAR